MKTLTFRNLCVALFILLILCLAAIFRLWGGIDRLGTYLEKHRQSAEDKHLSVEEVFLTVPGLKKDYTFLYVSDTHVVTTSDSDTSDVNAYAVSRLPMFVNEEGMSSARQFSGWIDLANYRQIDAMLMGGDIIDCPSDSNLSFLSEQLSRLEIPYLYTLGNHDWTLPWSYLNDHARDYYRPLFAPYMDKNPAFHVLRLEGLTIAAIDNSSDQIDPAVLEPLSALFSEGTPVILLLHVPLYTEDLAGKAIEVWGNPIVLGKGGISPNETSAAFLEMIYAEHSPVVAVLGGHLHFGAQTTLPNDIPQIVADGGYKGNGLILHVTAEN